MGLLQPEDRTRDSFGSVFFWQSRTCGFRQGKISVIDACTLPTLAACVPVYDILCLNLVTSSQKFHIIRGGMHFFIGSG